MSRDYTPADERMAQALERIADCMESDRRTAVANAVRRGAALLAEVENGRHMQSYTNEHAVTAQVAIGACSRALLELADEIEEQE